MFNTLSVTPGFIPVFPAMTFPASALARSSVNWDTPHRSSAQPAEKLLTVFTRTADVLPPSLIYRHVKMKNLKSLVLIARPPTKETRPARIASSCSLDAVIIRSVPLGLKVRHVIARPGGPGMHPLGVFQPCQGVTPMVRDIKPRMTASKQKPRQKRPFSKWNAPEPTSRFFTAPLRPAAPVKLPVKPKNPSKMPIIKVHQAQSSPRNGKDAAPVVPIIGLPKQRKRPVRKCGQWLTGGSRNSGIPATGDEIRRAPDVTQSLLQSS